MPWLLASADKEHKGIFVSAALGRVYHEYRKETELTLSYYPIYQWQPNILRYLGYPTQHVYEFTSM